MIAWEKLITWILVLVVIVVLIYFMVSQLGGSETSLISKIFGTANDVGTLPIAE